jgi:hypothetical protein
MPEIRVCSRRAAIAKVKPQAESYLLVWFPDCPPPDPAKPGAASGIEADVNQLINNALR